MRLREYFDTILASDPTDWYRVSGGDVPVFHSEVQPVHQAGGALGMDIRGIDVLIGLRTNIDITIGRGVTHVGQFREAWAKQFPDQDASSEYLHFFYRGAVVYHDILVCVDGGRAHLPMPDLPLMTVAKGAHDLARLLAEIRGGAREFDDRFKQAGLITVARPWPREAY